MKIRNIETALAIQYIHYYALNSLEQRTIMQKKLYLAQSLGANLGYQFNWYIRGPYSKELTSVAYDVISLGTSEFAGYRLSPNVIGILDKVNALRDKKPKTLTESLWFELLASLTFLRDEYGITGLKDEQKVKEKLRIFSPWHSDSNVDIAWNICQGIIKI